MGAQPRVARARPTPSGCSDFSVTIIGAGLGGLNAALMLRRAGIPYTHIEKNAGVGGTWHENRYPGARVDTPSRGYTHIFGAHFAYPYPFCPWTENQRYFDWVADTFDLRDDIVFNTEVRVADLGRGVVDVGDRRRRAGRRADMRSNAVITAVGFLNRPKIPEIEGMLDFAGPSWHTARWPEDVDLSGQAGRRHRHAAARATRRSRSSRSRPSTSSRSSARPSVAVRRLRATARRSRRRSTWLDRNFPFHTNFMRLRMTHGLGVVARMTEIDPEFEDPHAVSAVQQA